MSDYIKHNTLNGNAILDNNSSITVHHVALHDPTVVVFRIHTHENIEVPNSSHV